MKNRALALVVVGACGIAPQAWAHQLAYSKTEQIQVNVDGEATTWCKPEVAITMQRPTWDDQKPLNTLLSKLPYILGQECPTAQVTWKAVDAKGAVYATGAGNATNLGLATLTSPAAAAPAVSVAPGTSPPTPPAAVAVASVLPAAATATEPAVAAPVAAAPAPSPVTAAVIPQPAPEASPAPVQPVPVAQVPVTAPVAPVDAVATVSVEAAPAAVAAVPTGDFGRSLVLANQNLMGITDGSGCKWVISKSVTDESDPSLSFASTPAMPCPPSGYAEGAFDKLRWAVPNTYRGDTWSKTTVHPSGLMFNQALVPAVEGKALSFLNNRADQALFQVGELPARNMKVYLAFERPNYRVLSPFSSDPYYVVITADEAFALDAVELKRAVVEVYQLVKATSPTTVGLSNLFFAKNFEALYPDGYASETKDNILKTRMGENRGEFYFDARQGNNFALRREENRLREVRRLQQQMAELHTRVLERYEQLKSGMKEFEGRETEALAQMAGIKVIFPSPIAMQDPNSSKSAVPMMIHVTGRSGDFYEVDFPRKGRIQADAELESQWYVLPAANMTPFLPLEDGRAVPTYRVYTAGAAEACKQDHCADRVSFGAVLAKEFPSAGIDFNWTPAVSQQHVIDWQQASAQIQ